MKSRLKIIGETMRNGRIYLKCVCSCGNERVIYRHSIVSGRTKSCGCLKSHESSNRMKRRNPMWMPGILEKMIATNRSLGIKPPIRGGNGMEMPVPQRILLSALGRGWYAEHKVNTKKRHLGYPHVYKIDIASPSRMIAIEVDGTSHNSKTVKIADLKKERFLRSIGWKVLRFKNSEVMENISNVIAQII